MRLRQIIEEAGSMERLMSTEYQREAERAYQLRKAQNSAAPKESPQRLLRNAIEGIERKGLPVADILPELLMLLHVFDFLNQPEVRAIQERAA